MVVEKLNKVMGRKLVELLRVRRPDSLPHGDDEMMNKGLGVSLSLQISSESGFIVIGSQDLLSLAAKAKGVHKHTIKRRSQQVAPLSEERIQGAGAVLQI